MTLKFRVKTELTEARTISIRKEVRDNNKWLPWGLISLEIEEWQAVKAKIHQENMARRVF